jgi:RNA polymerase sigma factor (TIGR02999 family)
VVATLQETVTRLVTALEDGAEPREPVVSALMPVVYDQLRAMAGRYLRAERADHTLQPTALVHEAYLKLVDQDRVDWKGRSHFRAVGAQAMRRILIDHARRRNADKRGGGAERVTLTDVPLPAPASTLGPAEIIDLDRALTELSALDERQAAALEFRFYGDLRVADIALVLGVSKRTVEGDLLHGMAWLRRRLERGPGA